MKVRVHAPIRATEVPDKVADAAAALFDGDVALGADQVELRSDNVNRFRDRVWELRIIDTVRSRLLAGAKGDVLRFQLSKQAALANRVALPVSGHPLGDLTVHITLEPSDEWADAEALAWWICPETEDGQIVG